MKDMEIKWSEIYERNGYGIKNFKSFGHEGELYRNGSWRKVLKELSDYAIDLKGNNPIVNKYLIKF